MQAGVLLLVCISFEFCVQQVNLSHETVHRHTQRENRNVMEWKLRSHSLFSVYNNYYHT